MVQAGQTGCGSHGSYGKQEAEMRMKSMGTGDRLHKAGKQIPYIVFQNGSPLYDKHFFPVFPKKDQKKRGTEKKCVKSIVP